LDAGIVRSVGKPADRFREDPLRLLRAARFAAQLGFVVDPETEACAERKARDILLVSRERWVQELDKLLLADKPSIGLDFLARTRLLVYMIPELAIQVGYDQDSPYHELTLWEHTLSTVDLAPKDLNLRWAALFHDIGKPAVRTRNKRGYCNYLSHELVGAEIADRLCHYLKLSNERRSAVVELVRTHLKNASPIRAADNASKTRLP
jgi:putative nucleotidyltransferase with HDIG domain